DPPYGVGGEAEAAIGLEALHRLHHADVAFGDEFVDRKAVAAIAHRDLGHEPQMTGNELAGGFRIAMLAPTLGQHVLLVRLQHRKGTNLPEIALAHDHRHGLRPRVSIERGTLDPAFAQVENFT